MMEQTGAETLTRLLLAYKANTIFGVPGGQTLSFYDSIADHAPEIRHVLARDEKAGGLMAVGFSRVSFHPGLCDATVGPGAANLLPAVAEAYTGSVSMIAITSNVTTESMGKGASQELDHFALFRPFIKMSLRPKNVEDIPRTVSHAFKVATSGRPGPVHLDLPQDILESRTEESLPVHAEQEYATYPSYRPRPQATSTARARDLILVSSRPIILAGGGTILSQAWDEVKSLAETIGAPVVTTLTGKGIIDENHPLSLGCVGRQGYRPSANKALREADLILALGTKLGQVATNDWTLIDEQTKIIHVDIDPIETRKVYREELAIVADIRSTLRDLIESLSKSQIKPETPWLQKVRSLREEWVEKFKRSSTDALSPAMVFNEIMKSLPAKSVLVTSGSFAGAFSGCFYNVRLSGPRFIAARGAGGTETALPLAVGAALGVQDKSRVMAVSGEGGFGYHVAELETARRIGLALPVIVLNNRSLGWMKILQKERYGSNYMSSSYMDDLNYAKISESFGCKATRVERASELRDAVAHAVELDEVFVVEIMIDPDECSSTHLKSDPLAQNA
jgi:acetolactate synthase I/II/III large subunit